MPVPFVYQKEEEKVRKRIELGVRLELVTKILCTFTFSPLNWNNNACSAYLTELLYELYKMMMVRALVNYKVLYKCGLFTSAWPCFLVRKTKKRIHETFSRWYETGYIIITYSCMAQTVIHYRNLENRK